MGQTIIVTDDDAMNLRMAEFILKKEGYTVIKANSGIDCIDIVKKQSVDLILLDIMMPVMDGFETYDAIRKEENGKTVPIAFLSGAEEKDVLERAEQLDVFGCISKPLQPAMLVEYVKNAIG